MELPVNSFPALEVKSRDPRRPKTQLFIHLQDGEVCNRFKTTSEAYTVASARRLVNHKRGDEHSTSWRTLAHHSDVIF